MVKILIAEDEEPIANLIRMNLKKAGYACECAYDGQEAADRMEEGHYDLLLLVLCCRRSMVTSSWNMLRAFSFRSSFITAMELHGK